MLRYTDYDIVFQEVPDEITLAINISNCPNRCKGCHSPYLLKDIGEPLTEENLTVLLRKYGKAITCVCFMGGDASPADIEQLAEYLHRQTVAPVKVGWYSGKSELSPAIDLDFFEYIKLGPYIEHLGGLKSPATNQRFYRIENGVMKDITYRFFSTAK
ncbi:anaerobic ribonucleoside-triphosphate reductase activating protein [Parabacteroides faecis]|uniref:anaerobic ribonucleoside-triphosphate reductase activating protein n=1 Tax=Parabacteroides TaxID=375288 RepID=UPI000F009B2B|nr:MULTISPECIES: anaerobic ribonucleoside-triphosphate reductase activating protein [Parabacteroides]MBC8617483.1 anaerobic ribonucleoside-triphosphate reductase activating protein [Parabacteroides faecis]RHR99638.1 anaerobic ribonucleoside-triphosphate reductase activating protein [Parabacteroides sp. AF14-59]